MPLGIKVFLLFWLAGSSPLWAAPSLAQEKDCVQCHRFSPDNPEKVFSGPDLFYAGDKFQESWLRDFLRHPAILRVAGHTTDPGFLAGKPSLPTHPALSKLEADAMTGFLLTLRLADSKTGGVGPEPLSKGKWARAKFLFERDYGCIACHQGVNLAGKVRGGISGPSLVDSGNRLRADWVFNWLKTPKQFLRKGRMPVYDLDDATALLFTKYLMTLKKENLK